MGSSRRHDKAHYDKLPLNSSNSFIDSGGLFSIFEVQKQNIINDYGDLMELEGLSIDLEDLEGHSFQPISSVKTDPSQQNILHSLEATRNILIQGLPGTGKSQTLTAVLINALENNKKTIVVCEKRTAGNPNTKYYWLLLSFIFLFLSVDESVSIHESFTQIMPQFGIGGTGYFKFAWVIPYSVGVLLACLFFIRFLRSLQKPVKRGFILSGIVYIAGAIGFEMISARIAENNGQENISYALAATCEEMLEMAGLITFLNFIFKHIRSAFGLVSLTIK